MVNHNYEISDSHNYSLKSYQTITISVQSLHGAEIILRIDFRTHEKIVNRAKTKSPISPPEYSSVVPTGLQSFVEFELDGEFLVGKIFEKSLREVVKAKAKAEDEKESER